MRVGTGQRSGFKQPANGFGIDKQSGRRVIILIRKNPTELREIHAPQHVVGFSGFVG